MYYVLVYISRNSSNVNKLTNKVDNKLIVNKLLTCSYLFIVLYRLLLIAYIDSEMSKIQKTF